MRNLFATIILCSLLLTSNSASAEFRKDLALHAGISLVVSTASYHFYRQTLELTPTQSRVAAFFTTLAVGAIKEATDDKFSGSDMAANAGGAALGVAIAFDF